MAPFKPATDVVVIGCVHAPGGVPVRTLTAGVQIGTMRKVIAVSGDRTAAFRPGRLPMFSDPRPFVRLPLVYERAYGGTDRHSLPDIAFIYPRNPVGTGVVVANVPAAIDGLPLPNFEPPDDLLTPERLVMGEPKAWNWQPLPQGLGWSGKTWYRRCSFVGVLPPFVEATESMREEALGIVPRGQIALGRQFRLPSFDVRFNSGASLGLALPYLSGTETVRLVRLSREGDLSIRLPGERPEIIADIGAGEERPAVVLHSVILQPEVRQLELIWRGSLDYPGPEWLPHMRRLHAYVA